MGYSADKFNFTFTTTITDLSTSIITGITKMYSKYYFVKS